MNECPFPDGHVDPSELYDMGSGWTAYVREVKALSDPLEEKNMEEECFIAAFLAKVQGWHAAGQARVGHDDGRCKRCGRHYAITVFSPDVDTP